MEDVVITVKTSVKYHEERISVIADTWYNFAKETVIILYNV